MVYYFTSKVVSPPATIFMGKDKFENEHLIRWGWPEDVWFHVDNHSSAHVYLRLEKGRTLDDIPLELLNDCAQLVKANSIEGNKKKNVVISYTFWSNLKKTEAMDVGQVNFHNQKEVRTIKIEKRINDIINRLNKTKSEQHPDFHADREERDRQEREVSKMIQKEKKEKEKELIAQREEEAKLRSYSSLMSGQMHSNQDEGEDSDDFM